MEIEIAQLTLSSEDMAKEKDDPIPKVFAYFCDRAGKSKQYRLTEKRRKMAQRRWEEEVKVEKTSGTPKEKIRGIVGNRFKNVIDEICDCEFHRENGFLEWDQLFSSEDRFTKWVDRYENGFSSHRSRGRFNDKD